MKALSINFINRELKKHEAVELKNKGFIPAVVYKKGDSNLHIALYSDQVEHLLAEKNYFSRIIELTCEEEKHLVLIRDMQFDIVTDKISHIDFMLFDVNADRQKMLLPIEFINRDSCVGLKRGGFLNIVKRFMLVYIDPKNPPVSCIIDLSNMMIKDVIRSHDLNLPDGVKLIEKPFVVCSIIGKKGKSEDNEDKEAAADNKQKK